MSYQVELYMFTALKKRVLLYNIDLCLRTKKRGILVQKHEFMFYNLFVKICS